MCVQNCRKEHLKHSRSLTGKNHFLNWFPLQLGGVNLGNKPETAGQHQQGVSWKKSFSNLEED